MSAPRVSIVLPTLEGAEDLARLLPALAAQRLEGGFELLAVDSGSRDASRELLRAAGAHLEVIDRAEFSHGGTRNRRAAAARGEYLVFLSQDAEPADEDFLAHLIAPFSDPRVAGVCARVLPRPGDDLLAARTVLDLPEAGTEPKVWGLEPGQGLWDLAPEERARLLRFNNVASAARTELFQRIPFPDVAFGEDFAWAARVLTAGWKLAFAPASLAYHAHAYSPREAFRRYRIDAGFHRALHGWRMRPNLFSALRGWAFELRADWRLARRRGLGRHWRALCAAPLLRGAQVLGQYQGGRRPLALELSTARALGGGGGASERPRA